MRSSFNAGGKAAFEATGGTSTAGSVGGDAAGDGAAAAGSANAGGPPAWAQRMRRSQRMTHAVQATAHAVRSGDAHGGGSSVNLSEGDR
jgi:type IV secretion system protein TrbL